MKMINGIYTRPYSESAWLVLARRVIIVRIIIIRLIITRHEVSINQNKNFTCKVKKTKQNKVDLAGTGQFVTNCLKCNMTCHFPCQVSKDDEKYKCAAMNKRGDTDSTCSNCPGKCSWKHHVNNSYRFELYDDYETTTLQEIKNLYDTSVGEKCLPIFKSRLNNLMILYGKGWVILSKLSSDWRKSL